MVFDDGVVVRLADDRFHVTTTTGNAAAVLAWLEEWLQTEWPELDVACTSVTEQLSTVAVVGPRLAGRRRAAGAGRRLSADAFGFMTFRETTLANGLPPRVARISFSGELAYELSVVRRYGTALWDAVAGGRARPRHHAVRHRDHARAPRGEGVPDRRPGHRRHGDADRPRHGRGWSRSARTSSAGARCGVRTPCARTASSSSRCCPRTARRCWPRARSSSPTPDPPARMVGHVTSCYRSAALGRDVRPRAGRTAAATASARPSSRRWASGRSAATVHDPVVYDPEGARRDG